MRSVFMTTRLHLIGAFFLAVLVPYLVLAVRTERYSPTQGTWITGLAVTAAIAVGYGIWRRLDRFPSVQGGLYVLWAFVPCYILVMAIILIFRLEYNRLIFLSGFATSILWFIGLQFYIKRHIKPSFAIVPGGKIDRLLRVKNVNWLILREENLPDAIDDSFSLTTKDFKTQLSGAQRFGIAADLRHQHGSEWEQYIAHAVLQGIPVYHYKQLEEELTGQVNIEHMSENGFGSILPDLIYLKVKRMADLILVLLLTPVLIVIMAAVWLAIRLADGPPAIFAQERVGYRGNVFTAYKFRTMKSETSGSTTNAPANINVDMVPTGFGEAPQSGFDYDFPLPDDKSIPEITQPEDARITPLGRYLRKTRLDELPQIFNIIRGEMSWIGPRPEAVNLSRRYARSLPFYAYRHVVRPGITGWAQVRQGHVTSIDDVHEKLKYDYYYIKNISPWLDFLVLLKTVRIVFSGFGAK